MKKLTYQECEQIVGSHFEVPIFAVAAVIPALLADS
jgi:hypothetical protein